jgi:hypothetical protein
MKIQKKLEARLFTDGSSSFVKIMVGRKEKKKEIKRGSASQQVLMSAGNKYFQCEYSRRKIRDWLTGYLVDGRGLEPKNFLFGTIL